MAFQQATDALGRPDPLLPDGPEPLALARLAAAMQPGALRDQGPARGFAGAGQVASKPDLKQTDEGQLEGTSLPILKRPSGRKRSAGKKQPPGASRAIPMLDLRAQFAGIAKEALAAVERVLVSQQCVLGPEGEAFEREMAKYCGTRFGVGVASGTDAVDAGARRAAACKSPGDEVIIPAFTFIATAGAVSVIGARPVFADIDARTLNLDPASAEARIGPRTKAIVAVHLNGLPADLDALKKLAERHDVALVEDNAQSLGAPYRGKRLGACGTASATSFYPSKNLGACGDAGMVLTDSEELAARVRRLRNHGQADRYVSHGSRHEQPAGCDSGGDPADQAAAAGPLDRGEARWRRVTTSCCAILTG